MKFKLCEFEFGETARPGDIAERLANAGFVPAKVRNILAFCISEIRLQDLLPEKDRKVVLCRAVLEDGRTYWTITCFAMTRKKILIKRTSVWSAEGKQVFSARTGPSGALHGMEGKRMDKILRSVMSS